MIRGLAFIIAFLALLYVAQHWGDDPQPLAVEAVPAKVTKSQAPMCTAPWTGTLKKKGTIA